MTDSVAGVRGSDAQPAADGGDVDRQFEGLTIVGIGASAGGLAALTQLFKAMPGDTGMAFVVVVHLSPKQESHLADLLQPHCGMPVQQVTRTLPIKANHVYVIPPNANLDSVDTHLRLTELEEARAERAPIDHFFRTLASTHDGHAIGVVLTGTGSDGTLGLRRINEAGGVSIVQSPDEAEYDGMPRHAIATGFVDLVLPLAEIPAHLQRICQTRPSVPETPADASTPEEDEQVLQKIFAQVRSQTGHDFNSYKRSTILRRIARRMQLHAIERLPAYLDRLRGDRQEVVRLFEDLVINVTEFFRDPDVYGLLAEQTIPRLFEDKAPDDDLRVWSVGCSTGEEAYSLAMLLLEEAGRREVAPRIQVFASDLQETSLRKAREGLYPDAIASDVSAERLRRFFTKEDGYYRVRKEVRELIVFAEHSLLKDPPFSHMDLVVCRNVLIYLRRAVQHEVAQLFHYAIKDDGVLLLGSSETLDGEELFVCEDKTRCLYRRRSGSAAQPKPLLRHFPFTPSRWSPRRGEPADEVPARPHQSFGVAHAELVEQYAPPSLLVSQNHDVVHSSASAGEYLQVPPGEPTQNLFHVVREGLRIELRAVLHTARKSGKLERSRPVRVAVDGQTREVVIRVRSVEGRDTSGFFLVIFDEVQPATARSDADAEPRESATIRELEAELHLTKQRLQSSIEEFETSQEEMQASNEELQSANEELRSTMEELETSKEELQSMNEELATVNQENRHRVEELSQLSGDLQNLMAATQIATLFLDRQLRIVRFTPPVTTLFNIRNTDRSRPLSDLTHNLIGDPQLLADAQSVLDRLTPVEREVLSTEGQWFLLRILPYRTASDRVDGVVLTLIDITSRKHTEQSLQQSEERFRVLVEASAMMVWETDASGRVRADSPSWRAQTGQTLEQWLDQGWPEVVHPEDRERVIDAWQQTADSQRTFNIEFRVKHVDGGYRWTNALAAPVRDESGEIREWVGMNLDITDRKTAEQLLVESRNVLEQRVAQRTAALQEHADRLRHMSSELGMIERRERKRLASLLHDGLQQVLIAVKIRLDMLRLDDAEGLREDVEGVRGLVEEAMSSSRDLTRQLRPPVLYEGGLIPALEWLAEDVKQRLGLSVQLEHDGQTGPLSDDTKSLVFEAVRELLLNVVKHAEVGEVFIKVGRAEDRVLVQVRDEGKGFDPSVEVASMGLGLFSVRERIAALGGEVEIQTKPGGGVRTRLVVPAEPAAPGDEPRQAPAGEPQARPVAVSPDTGMCRVLIVDDHAMVRQGIATMLHTDPNILVVAEAQDGSEATEAVARHQPDVVLLDVNMPVLNGPETTRRIRDQWPHVQVVGLSVQDDEATARLMLDAGACAFISKSADAGELIAAVLGNASYEN